MVYMPSLQYYTQRQDNLAMVSLMKFEFQRLHDIVIPKAACANCGIMTDKQALRVRHGLTNSYATCPACDIELENPSD